MRRLNTAATALVVGIALVTSLAYAAYAATDSSRTVGKVSRDDQTTNMPNAGSGPAVASEDTMSEAAPSSVNVGRSNADSSAASRVPVATGHVNAVGSLIGGVGVDAVDWQEGNQRYVITLTNRTYANSSYATVVTPTCAGFTVSTLSAAGDLVITMRNPSGTAVQCAFAFVTYDI